MAAAALPAGSRMAAQAKGAAPNEAPAASIKRPICRARMMRSPYTPAATQPRMPAVPDSWAVGGAGGAVDGDRTKFAMAPDPAIHQRARILKSARRALPGPWPRPAEAAGTPPGPSSRPGSFSHSTAGTTASATRQPNACATGPPMAKLNMPSTATAIMSAAMARARRSAGTRSPIQLAATGAHTASPIPTPSRVASSIA